jgi:hypothetical protein
MREANGSQSGNGLPCLSASTTYHRYVMEGGVSLWDRMLSKRELRERELLPLPVNHLDEVAK